MHETVVLDHVPLVNEVSLSYSAIVIASAHFSPMTTNMLPSSYQTVECFNVLTDLFFISANSDVDDHIVVS